MINPSLVEYINLYLALQKIGKLKLQFKRNLILQSTTTSLFISAMFCLNHVQCIAENILNIKYQAYFPFSFHDLR